METILPILNKKELRELRMLNENTSVQIPLETGATDIYDSLWTNKYCTRKEVQGSDNTQYTITALGKHYLKIRNDDSPLS